MKQVKKQFSLNLALGNMYFYKAKKSELFFRYIYFYLQMDYAKRQTLNEDQKKFRKLRKVLRQIEHLQLLTRPLNSEEKLKLSKRSCYRDELNQLTSKYKANNELFMLLDSSINNTTTNTNCDNTVNSTSNEQNIPTNEYLTEDDTNHSQFLSNSYIQSDNSVYVEEVEEENKDNNGLVDQAEYESFNNNLNELSDRLSIALRNELKADEPEKNEIDIKAVDEPKKKNKKKEHKQAPVQPILQLPTAKPEVKKNPIKPRAPAITFDTLNVTDAHQDLIMSIDVCAKSQLIVTGSRDTTIKVWRLSHENNRCELVRSFGGHSSPITRVKFWSIDSYRTALYNLKESEEQDESLVYSFPGYYNY